ncbi:hypothetical protein PMAC_001816 [Pneumocystis sp. 'macacae']|nr:hypothetical protein PMAC_001816 [Pneumocystis sp. 'macacae']
MEDNPSNLTTTIQDAFVSAITSSLALNSPKGDSFSSQVTLNDEEYIPTPFSLHILTQNFRKLSSRVGIIFQTRDILASIFQWEVPSKTLSFMCIYTIICTNPSFVLVIPTTVFIFGLLLPSYEARYPDSNSSLLNKEIILAKKSQANGKNTEGRDFTIDMRNIQVICYIFNIITKNISIQKAVKVLIEEYKKNQLKHSSFFLNYDFIYDWIDYNYIPPEIPKKVIFVEIFEFVLKTDQENGKIIYYSSNPYALPPNKESTPAEEGLRELLYDDSSITGSMSCIHPPNGYKFEKNSYWKLDTNNLENLRFNSTHKDWSRRRLTRENIPVTSTQNITHFLKSKSEALEEQLKTAYDLLEGHINVYFIQKEGFLLNWILDKLKEIKLNKSESITILPKLWNFLDTLLKSQTLLAESKYFNLQKHSFVALLSISLSLATELVDENQIFSLLSSIQKTLNYVLSEKTLSLFIRGSFDTTTTILANFFYCIRNLNLYNDTISNLGYQIFKIWKNSIYGFENFKNVFASRILPYACYVIGKNGILLWVNDLFSIILHKTLFSPELLINYINFQISNPESKNMVLKTSNLELFFNCLLSNLPDISYHHNVLLSLPKLLEIAQNSISCNLIYSKVKINLNPSKIVYLTNMFLFEILKLAIKLSVENTLKYSTISDILELSKNNSTYYKTFTALEQQMFEILKKSFSLIKDQKDIIIIGWKLLYNLLKIDSELILPYNEQLWLSFCEVDITSEYSKMCYKVIKILVNNHRLHRNLHKFIHDWIKFLNFPLNNNCILLSDEILTIVMQLTTDLSLNQIRTIIDYILKENNFEALEKSIHLNQKNNLSSKNLFSLNISKNTIKSSFFVFYPLLCIMHESIDFSIIRDICKDFIKLYEFILIKVFSNISFFLNDLGIYLIFRIHYKAMQLSYEYISFTDPLKTLEYIKSITMFKGLDSKIIFYATQCQLIYIQYFDQCNSKKFKTEDLMSLMDLVLDHILFCLENTSINSFWKAGKMQLINNTNISIAYIYMINNQWLYLVNKLSFFDKIKEIMNFLLKYTVQNTSENIDIDEILTFSNLWYIYLSNAEIYELELFRNASLFVLMSYIFSNEIDKLLFLNDIETYFNEKTNNFIETKINNFNILEFRKLIKCVQIIPINSIEDLTKEKLLDFLLYKDFQFNAKECFIDILVENRKLMHRIMVTTNGLNSMVEYEFHIPGIIQLILILSFEIQDITKNFWKTENINMVANILSAILLIKIEKDKLREEYLEYLELFQTIIFRLILIAKRTTDLEILYVYKIKQFFSKKSKSYFSLQNLDQLFVIIVTSLSPLTPIFKISSDITIDDIYKEVKDILTLLVMEIFKIFSKYEFEIINNTLDNHGKIIFKKLYDDYLQYDKWNEG